MKVAMLTDTTKCIGCYQCVEACKKVNHLKDDVPRRWDADDGLSANNWTAVIAEPDNKYVRKQCRHCLEPACVAACPVGAMHKTELGPVIYDKTKCIGCRYCMVACPFGIPRYEWNSPVPYVRKCIFCYDVIEKGGKPACTEICPTKATIFGDRDELLAEAHGRIAAEPGKYANKVWGEQEAGGTSVFYISDIDLSFLTYGQHLGNQPLPHTTRAAMEAVPFAFVGMGTAMAGLYWIIGRRKKLQAEQAQGKGASKEEDEKL